MPSGEGGAGQATAIGPAELDALRPTLSRIARVAKTMFGTPLADVALFREEGVWRAGDTAERVAPSDPASELVRTSKSGIWVENLAEDERFAHHPTVAGAPHLRFYAGAPIALEGGATVGAIAVYGLKPRAWEQRLADRLKDLADVVGHECDRIIAQAERATLLEEIKRQEERLQTAVEAAKMHVFDMDIHAQTLIKTGIEETFFERPLSWNALASGKSLYVHPDFRDEAIAKAQSLVAGQDYDNFEWQVARSDGAEVWVTASARMVTDKAGRPARVVGSLQDITERKKAERALAEAKARAESANTAKSAFLATMSHEIRTPLNGVLGMAQAMAADELSAVQRERLDVVRQSGEALLAILNDLLDFSKIEAGKLDLEEIDFDLAEIARGAYATFTALANKKGLSFSLDVEEAHGLYRGDPTRIRQILYNLISNALKFTNEGEIRVRGAYEGGRLKLSVDDTGIGMSAETLDGLFGKFNQADASTTRKFGGTGLGLAICKELANLMGGQIEVDSVPGRGSTFTVSLPVAKLSRSASTTAATSVAAGKGAVEPAKLEMRVLAAEDNAVNQLVLKTLLYQIGVEPTVVENGALAVEAFQQSNWDLVLMDVQMPVMDGPTAVRTMRKWEAETGRPRTPIVALTANAMSHQVSEYVACGMDGHLAKPIEVAKLFQVLASVFETSEKQAQASLA